MSIINKASMVREIAMMIRKDCVVFEPSDRVAVGPDVASSSGRCYVSEVYHDFDTGRACYRLVDGDGLLIVPSSGPRFLEDVLSPAELSGVKEKVVKYTARAMERARNIALISDALSRNDDGIIFWKGADVPTVLVDRHRTGSLDSLPVEALYYTSRRDAIYLKVGDPVTGETFGYPLSEVSDMGVGNVLQAIERQQGLSKGREVERRNNSQMKM